MSAEETAREREYWRQFAETGCLPAVPQELVAGKGVEYARSIIRGEYNHLARLLIAEALAVQGALEESDARAQGLAAKWVRVMIFSKKNAYARKDEMLASLAAFMESSANPVLACLGGLAKAEGKVSALSRAGQDASTFSQACLTRMKQVVEERPWIAETAQFAQLVIAIGWEFVKRLDYDRLAKALSLLSESIRADQYLSERISGLEQRLGEAALQPLRDWPKKAKDVYQGLPQTSAKVAVLLQELLSQVDHFKEMRQDGVLRNLILSWTAILLGKLGRLSNGIPLALGRLFVDVMRADGLESVPDQCWVQQKMNPPPEKGDGVFPATIEKLMNGLYGIVKEAHSRQRLHDVCDPKTLDWLIRVMQDVYKHLPDENWGDFRIGKLMMFAGRVDEAKDLMLPVIRRNQTQFWAWDVLGQLFPERRLACLARALLCGGEEVMLSKIKRDAQTFELPTEDPEALREIAAEADELILDGMPCLNGVLAARYVNKEGKNRVRFTVSDTVAHQELRPVSPGALKLPRKMKVGAPVRIYLDESDASKIVAVRSRDDGSSWDVLPQTVVVYYGRSRKGNAQLASATVEMSCRDEEFALLKNAKPGDAFSVRYATRKTDYGVVHEVRKVEYAETKPDCTFSYEGCLRLPNGDDSAGFVENVYIPPELVKVQRGRGVLEGTPVSGMAVRLPSKPEVDRFGHQRLKQRNAAISMAALSGSMLDRYLSMHGAEEPLER